MTEAKRLDLLPGTVPVLEAELARPLAFTIDRIGEGIVNPRLAPARLRMSRPNRRGRQGAN